jgi:hypothetical protein
LTHGGSFQFNAAKMLRSNAFKHKNSLEYYHLVCSPSGTAGGVAESSGFEHSFILSESVTGTADVSGVYRFPERS